MSTKSNPKTQPKVTAEYTIDLLLKQLESTDQKGRVTFTKDQAEVLQTMADKKQFSRKGIVELLVEQPLFKGKKAASISKALRALRNGEELPYPIID